MLSDAWRSVVADVQPCRIEAVAARKDGTTFDVDLVLAPIIGLEGKASGVVCEVRDITDYKRMEAGLRLALEQQKELNELKSRFVAMASHEFLTPLTTILGSTGLLELRVVQITAGQRPRHFDKIQ